MSRFNETVDITISVPIEVEYAGEEKPDYSDLSPCAWEPEYFAVLNVFRPKLPTTPEALCKLLDKEEPGWEKAIMTRIKKRIENAKAEAVIARHIWREAI